MKIQKEMTHQKFENFLKEDMAYCERKIKNLSKAISNDPAHSLEWSNSEFELAARIKVIGWILAYLKSLSIQTIAERLVAKVLSDAQNPPQSTSPTGNLMNQYTTAAFAKYAAFVIEFE